MRINLDFYIHWIWTATFGVLAITGFALMGARYGWIMNYALPLADYLHRTLAALFVVLLTLSLLLEAFRLTGENKPAVWLMVGTKPYQVFTLITTLLLVLSGIFIWVCMEWSAAGMAFSMMVHEIVSFLALGSLIWHIYQKAHAIKT